MAVLALTSYTRAGTRNGESRETHMRKMAAFLLAAGTSLAFQALAAEPTPGLKPGDEVPPAFAQHVAGPDQGTLTCPI